MLNLFKNRVHRATDEFVNGLRSSPHFSSARVDRTVEGREHQVSIQIVGRNHDAAKSALEILARQSARTHKVGVRVVAQPPFVKVRFVFPESKKRK